MNAIFSRGVAKLLILWGGVFLLAMGDNAPVANQPTREDLQRLYIDYLTEEGYRPIIDDDGDVQFKREGKYYFIQVDEDDPEFFILVLANVWPIESEGERIQVLVAADVSNGTSKASKVQTVGDDVWVSVELFLVRPEDFKEVFERSLEAIDNGLSLFVEKMRE